MLPYARRHFARGPCRAASAARGGGGSRPSAPARSALSAFAGAAQGSGILHHCPIRAGCDTQRHVRRLPIGPAVMPSARGVCMGLAVVLVCGPFTTANRRLRSAATRERSDSCRVEPRPTFGPPQRLRAVTRLGLSGLSAYRQPRLFAQSRGYFFGSSKISTLSIQAMPFLPL